MLLLLSLLLGITALGSQAMGSESADYSENKLCHFGGIMNDNSSSLWDKGSKSLVPKIGTVLKRVDKSGSHRIWFFFKVQT